VRPEQQREIVGRILDLAERGTTQLAESPLRLPVTDYVSHDVFAAEQEQLFRDRPVVACMSCDVREPGECFATESGGVPFVVVRHGDGTLRAFANICRHRGSPLVAPGPGHLGRSFRCGFHGWVYDLNGAVTGRPNSCGGFDLLDVTTTSLLERPVCEAHGMVFVRPSGEAPIDLDELLCGMGDELDSFGFDRYHRFAQWDSTWAANWKLLVDTFLETYHVPALHPDTVARYFLSSPSVFATFGPNIRFHSLMKSVLEERDRPEAEWELLSHGTVEYFIAPNTVLNYSVDHLALYQFTPDGPHRSRVSLTMYTPSSSVEEPAAAHFRRTLELHQRVSGDQDFTKQEAIHRAISSGAMHSVVFGRNEPAAIHFHESLRNLLGS
jgi:phenylpropionate dioxygenase-like ring-hydroxylating dioxygenase large terminal subunit